MLSNELMQALASSPEIFLQPSKLPTLLLTDNMSFLPGWYAICTSARLKQAQPLPLRVFGRELVLWRTTGGETVLMDDRCPHRGAKLSPGRSASTIVCPYHGFEFSPQGDCVLVPETGCPSKNLTVRVHPVREQHGLIWLYHGPDEATHQDEKIHWFSDVDETFSISSFDQTWNTHITRCIENQLDYAHLAFVHRTTIGSRFDPKVKVFWDLTDTSIGFRFKETGMNAIEYLAPNVWINRISKQLKLVLLFIPIDEDNTRIELVSYQSICRVPLLREALESILRLVNTKIINQDKAVVLSQTPKCSIGTDEKLFMSDKAIAHFRKLWESGRLEP